MDPPLGPLPSQTQPLVWGLHFILPHLFAATHPTFLILCNLERPPPFSPSFSLSGIRPVYYKLTIFPALG